MIHFYEINRSLGLAFELLIKESYSFLLFIRKSAVIIIALTEILLLHKTLPHLVPTGKWSGYWLKTGPGKVELGYYGVKNSFFEWSSIRRELSFEPMYLNYGTIKNHWIGVNFECNECFIIQTNILKENKIYPINLWKEEKEAYFLELNLRGTGSAYITLMWTPALKKHLGIHIFMSNIYIIKYNHMEMPNILAAYPVQNALSEVNWSKFIISFTENILVVRKEQNRLFEWLSPFPLFFYWFSVTAEKGPIIWTANCPPADIDGEPRDGHWGKWGPWSCSVSCGGGEGRIERECNNPAPNIFGKECKGSPIYEGPCNVFPCGEISPRSYNLIRNYLSSQFKSLVVHHGERVVLDCNPSGLLLILSEAYLVNFTWTHNGFPYRRTEFHMNKNYSLVLSRAHEKHNGVYICMAFQNPDSVPSKIVLEVISLVVKRTKPKKVRKGRSFILKCNGLALSYVYADLSQRWELNGHLYKDYGLGTLEAFTVDKLENVTNHHDGIWTCVIIQEDFQFRWETNWISLQVTKAPSFWSHLMEDVATAPLFGRLGNERNAMILFFILIGAIIILVLGVTVCLVRIIKR